MSIRFFTEERITTDHRIRIQHQKLKTILYNYLKLSFQKLPSSKKEKLNLNPINHIQREREREDFRVRKYECEQYEK